MSQEDPNIHALFRVKDRDLKIQTEIDLFEYISDEKTSFTKYDISHTF